MAAAGLLEHKREGAHPYSSHTARQASSSLLLEPYHAHSPTEKEVLPSWQPVRGQQAQHHTCSRLDIVVVVVAAPCRRACTVRSQRPHNCWQGCEPREPLVTWRADGFLS